MSINYGAIGEMFWILSRFIDSGTVNKEAVRANEKKKGSDFEIQKTDYDSLCSKISIDRGCFKVVFLVCESIFETWLQIILSWFDFEISTKKSSIFYLANDSIANFCPVFRVSNFSSNRFLYQNRRKWILEMSSLKSINSLHVNLTL